MRGYRTTTHTYQQVSRQQRVTVTCSGCGKDRVRTVSVTHTINPFNRNELGQPRSPAEVLDRVRIELAECVREAAARTIICKTCTQKNDAASYLQSPAEA
jgi:hypothetical protein